MSYSPIEVPRSYTRTRRSAVLLSAAGAAGLTFLAGCTAKPLAQTAPSTHATVSPNSMAATLTAAQEGELSNTAKASMAAALHVYEQLNDSDPTTCGDDVSTIAPCRSTVSNLDGPVFLKKTLSEATGAQATLSMEFDVPATQMTGTTLELVVDSDGWLPAQQFAYTITMQNPEIALQSPTDTAVTQFIASPDTHLTSFTASSIGDGRFEDSASIDSTNVMQVTTDSANLATAAQNPTQFVNDRLSDLQRISY